MECFDSILVRLKDFKDEQRAFYNGVSFDSILVRLKVSPKAMTLTASMICFDSILVRLKVDMDDLFTWADAFKFRFHTGSIKRSQLRPSVLEKLSRFDSKMVRLKVCHYGSLVDLFHA